MTSVNHDLDLKSLNLQFLMVARECARYNPIHAVWKFNLSDQAVGEISRLTIDDLTEWASCGRAVFTVVPALNRNSTVPLSILGALSTAATDTATS